MKGILPFAVLLLVRFTNATQCSRENVETCVANMKQFELDEYASIVPTWTDSEITDMCTEYNTTDVCIEAFINDCSAYDQYYYRAVEDSWDYICEDKKQEYLDVRDCLAHPTLHTQAETHCKQIWEKRVTDLDQDKFRHATGALNTDGVSSLCNSATEYLNCVYTEVELECGEEAAAWQRGFDDTLIQPILKVVGCQAESGMRGRVYFYNFKTTTSATTTTTDSATAATSTTSSVLIIASLMCYSYTLWI